MSQEEGLINSIADLLQQFSREYTLRLPDDVVVKAEGKVKESETVLSFSDR